MYSIEQIKRFVDRETAGTDATIQKKREIEAGIRAQIEATAKTPVIRVEFFHLLNPNVELEEMEEARRGLSTLLNREDIHVQDIDFQVFEQPILDREEAAVATLRRTHYTVTVQYALRAPVRRNPDYRLAVYELPDQAEELGVFLSSLCAPEVVTEGGYRYNKSRAVMRVDKVIDKNSGRQTLYYHTCAKFDRGTLSPVMEDARAPLTPPDPVVVDISLPPPGVGPEGRGADPGGGPAGH